MRVNREKIQRMIGAQSSGSGGGGGMSSAALENMLAMYATRQWVGENFLNVKEGGTVEAAVTFQEAVTLEKTLAVTGAVTMASTLAVTGDITMGSKLVATQEWANNTFVQKNWFDQVFQIFNDQTKIAVNGDLPIDQTKMNIKAMFGFWTNFYISALGTGGQSALGLRLSQLDDVNVAGVTNGQVLTWDASQSKWIAATPSSGVDMATVWAALAAQDASKKIDISHFPTLFTDLSNTNDSPKKLSMTIGGTTKSIVVAYATEAGDAATIGGTAKSGLFTDLSNTGNNQISVTIGGTTRSLTVNYATYANEANRLSGNSTYSVWGQTYWSSGTPNDVTGTANMSRGLKVGNIYFECNSLGTYDSNRGNEINNYSNQVAIQYNSSHDVTLCYGGGNVGIGVSSPSHKLHVNGGILSTSYVTALSDVREKRIMDRFTLNVEAIAGASLIHYRWKDGHDDLLHAGGIAQEWQKILPEAVIEDEAGRLSMDYGVIGMVSAVSLARKIQDQQKEICDLREKNAQLEHRLQRLESMFAVDVD